MKSGITTERRKRMNMSRVINFVGAVLVLSTGLIGGLAWHGDAIPDVLQNIAVGSMTGLVGLLAKPSPDTNVTER